MLKILLCLFTGLLTCIALLQLRQQHLELNCQVNRLHNDIERQQARLWDQQLQIAMYTAPNAISKTVDQQNLKMVPQKTLPAQESRWIDVRSNPDAE
jgi:cell division protein FtsL